MEAARRASIDDLPSVAVLADAALNELSAARGGPTYLRRENRRQPPLSTLTAALEDPDQHVVVGTVDDSVVGYGVVRLDTKGGEASALIDDLYVDPEARGIGVGESIMNELLRWSTAQGAISVEAIVLPGLRHTKNFFESFGMVARAILVHRPLADGSRP